jgi:hypothetical protein
LSNAPTLVGLPVCADGVRLGTVGAVWVDALDRVLGMEVDSAWSADVRYLPYAATTVLNGTITTTSLSVLAIDATTFFAERGARRVTAAEALGFARADHG